MNTEYEEHNRHEHGLFDTIRRIHGSQSGSGDTLPEAESTKLLTWLLWRVEDAWEDSCPVAGWKPYEDAIRAMVRALLKVMDADAWAVDCQSFHGRILYGKHAHWCVDWDDLPIDESSNEYHLNQVVPDDTDVPCASCGFMSDPGKSGER